MLNKTFYLFSALSLLFFTSSCEKCEKGDIYWGNTFTANFNSIALSVPGYATITNFDMVFNHPNIITGVKLNSMVTQTSKISNKCMKTQDDYFNQYMNQDYKFMGQNPLHQTPTRPWIWYQNNMTIENMSLNFWHSDKGNGVHTYSLEIKSGPYLRVNGQWYDLIWNYSADFHNKNNFTINQSAGTVTMNSPLNVTGAPVNVTPDRPFIHHIYLDGSLKPYTLENVSMPNDMLTLKVK